MLLLLLTATLFVKMIETPKLDHITKLDLKHVYEPSEDTFLMMDALEKDITLDKFCHSSQTPIVLELGSGSGCVSAFANEVFLKNIKRTCLSLCTDINYHAALLTAKTGLNNGNALNSICDNFCDSLCQRLKNSVDILIFNPPYVETSKKELLNAKDIELSWAGGERGREPLDNLIKSQVPSRILSENGFFYIIMVKRNRPQEFLDFVTEHGLEGKIFMERKTALEHLYVVKLRKRNQLDNLSE